MFKAEVATTWLTLEPLTRKPQTPKPFNPKPLNPKPLGFQVQLERSRGEQALW